MCRLVRWQGDGGVQSSQRIGKSKLKIDQKFVPVVDFNQRKPL
jgi:hypothetical protein